jgi:anti-sigma-K factor RskA
METEVENQVAAPAETRTPNWHRANKNRSLKSADGRVATVAIRRERKTLSNEKTKEPT